MFITKNLAMSSMTDILIFLPMNKSCATVQLSLAVAVIWKIHRRTILSEPLF